MRGFGLGLVSVGVVGLFNSSFAFWYTNSLVFALPIKVVFILSIFRSILSWKTSSSAFCAGLI